MNLNKRVGGDLPKRAVGPHDAGSVCSAVVVPVVFAKTVVTDHCGQHEWVNIVSLHIQDHVEARAGLIGTRVEGKLRHEI